MLKSMEISSSGRAREREWRTAERFHLIATQTSLFCQEMINPIPWAASCLASNYDEHSSVWHLKQLKRCEKGKKKKLMTDACSSDAWSYYELYCGSDNRVLCSRFTERSVGRTRQSRCWDFHAEKNCSKHEIGQEKRSNWYWIKNNAQFAGLLLPRIVCWTEDILVVQMLYSPTKTLGGWWAPQPTTSA